MRPRNHAISSGLATACYGEPLPGADAIARPNGDSIHRIIKSGAGRKNLGRASQAVEARIHHTLHAQSHAKGRGNIPLPRCDVPADRAGRPMPSAGQKPSSEPSERTRHARTDGSRRMRLHGTPCDGGRSSPIGGRHEDYLEKVQIYG